MLMLDIFLLAAVGGLFAQTLWLKRKLDSQAAQLAQLKEVVTALKNSDAHKELPGAAVSGDGATLGPRKITEAVDEFAAVSGTVAHVARSEGLQRSSAETAGASGASLASVEVEVESQNPAVNPGAGEHKLLKVILEHVQANWTGFLGAVITVLGIGFFGTMAGSQLGPIGRCSLILLVAMTAYAVSFWLQKRQGWLLFATWLEGIAGATFLLVSMGASGIHGLAFIDSELLARAVLACGVLINLLFAWRAAYQAASAFHVVVGLLALSFAPAGMLSLTVGALVIIFGTLMSYRKVWDINLVAIIVSGAVFQISWQLRTELALLDFKWAASAVCCVLALAAALVHYRKEYQVKTFQSLAFVAHLVNWFLFAVVMMRLSTGSAFTPAVLSFATLGAFIMSRVAARKGIGWLATTDNLVAQFIGVAAIVSFTRFGLRLPDTLVFIYLQLITCALINMRIGQDGATKVGLGLVFAGQIVIFGFIGMYSGDATPVSQGLRLVLVAMATWGFGMLAVRMQGEKSEQTFSYLGRWIFMFPAIFLAVAFTFIKAEIYGVYMVTALFFAMLATSKWIPKIALNISMRSCSIGLGIFLTTVSLLMLGLVDAPEYLLWHYSLVPLVGLFVLQNMTYIWRGGNTEALRITAYFFFSFLGVGLYATLVPRSDFLPGVVAALLSMVWLELGLYIQKRSESLTGEDAAIRLHQGLFVVHGSVFCLLYFLVRHLLVHIQTEQTLFAGISLRLVLEVLGFMVLGYFLLEVKRIKPVVASATKKYRVFSSMFIELFLGFLALVITVECEATLRPLAWIVLALVLNYLVTAIGKDELKVHGYLFYFLSCLNLAAVTSIYETGAGTWYTLGEVTGVMTIFLQIGYLTFLYRIGPPLSQEKTSYLEKPAALLNRYLIPFMLYPFFVGVAVYLYWRFDKAILTLLWVMEIFAIFVLGIYLRSKHFVYLALAALALSVTRLIFFDLASTSLATRGLVFVGVGVLMLGINVFYKKYSDRIK